MYIWYVCWRSWLRCGVLLGVNPLIMRHRRRVLLVFSHIHAMRFILAVQKCHWKSLLLLCNGTIVANFWKLTLVELPIKGPQQGIYDTKLALATFIWPGLMLKSYSRMSFEILSNSEELHCDTQKLTFAFKERALKLVVYFLFKTSFWLKYVANIWSEICVDCT